jgi:uncharacterized protein DUF262
MSEAQDVKPLIADSSTSESTSVEVVLNDLRDGIVQIPDYQRDSDQWAEPTKSLLVASVINNLSIPAFFFEVTVEHGVERNQVIDGQQRITTLSEFFRNKLRLVDSQEAPYISPNSVHYAGKTYDELPTVYQQAFKKYRLAVIKLRDLKGMRLEVFRRINQGGTPLSGPDIRLAYYGEDCASLAFIRLVGIYDNRRQAAERFLSTAKNKYKLEFPWLDGPSRETWHDLWDGKDLARGQTASEMFLWSLMAAQYAELDDILQNTDALTKLGVRFNRGIDEALDVYCAQLLYQERHPQLPAALMPLDKMQSTFFPFFAAWITKLGAYGSSLDVRKHRTVASMIGAAFRRNVGPKLSMDQWGQIVEVIRRPTECGSTLGIDWPQSKGRWDGRKGHRAQMEAASAIMAKIAA